MRFPLRRLVSLLAVVLLTVSGAATIAVADADYELSPTNTIDTPDRTVTVDGSDYEVSYVGRVLHGNTLELDATAPDDASYQVYLYNDDRAIVDTKRLSGDGTATFETDSLDPGTYISTIYGPDGQFRDVVPVVVAGYTVDVSAPDTVTKGNTFEVTVSLENVTRVVEPQIVEVVVSRNNTVHARNDAVRQSVDQYAVAVEANLPVEEYDLYVNVRGNETAQGRNELIGISEPRSLDVQDASNEPTETPEPTATPEPTDTPEESAGGSGSGGSGGSGGGGAASTPTRTAVPTETVVPTDVADTPTPMTTSTSTVSEPTETATSDVVTPSADTPSTTATNAPSYALYVVAGLLLLYGAGHRLQE